VEKLESVVNIVKYTGWAFDERAHRYTFIQTFTALLDQYNTIQNACKWDLLSRKWLDEDGRFGIINVARMTHITIETMEELNAEGAVIKTYEV